MEAFADHTRDRDARQHAREILDEGIDKVTASTAAGSVAPARDADQE